MEAGTYVTYIGVQRGQLRHLSPGLKSRTGCMHKVLVREHADAPPDLDRGCFRGQFLRCA